jgi:hypothetical protein
MFDPSNTSDAHRIRRSPLLAVVVTLGLAVQPINLVPSTLDTRVPAADRGSLRADALKSSTPRRVAAPTENFSTTTVPPVTTVPVEPTSDPFAMITSPDVGDHCAEGLSADALTDFFSEPIGALQGADYQRAFRLADDRVLWTFQDAFISGTLVHNVGSSSRDGASQSSTPALARGCSSRQRHTCSSGTGSSTADKQQMGRSISSSCR